MLPFLVGRYTYYATRLIHRLNSMLHDAGDTHNNTARGVTEIVSQARGLDVTCGLANLPANEDPNVQFWTIYRMTTIKLHHCLILLINFVVDIECGVLPDEELINLGAQRSASLDKLRRAADDILDTAGELFYSMGVTASSDPSVDEITSKGPRRLAGVCWADSLRLVPAIVLVGLLPSTNTEQKRKAKVALGVIGIQFRIRLATVQNYHVPPIPMHMRWRENIEDLI